MAINFPSTAVQATDGTFTYVAAGITYSWDGSSWRAAGAGASATDKTLFSVTQNAAGSAALSYDSNTGVFSYTPPDLSSYITSESDTLQSVTARGATTNQNITIEDDKYLYFGTHFYLRNRVFSGTFNHGEITHTGDSLTIQSNNFVIDAVGGVNMLDATSGGAVKLYYNGSAKIQTTNTGATITGALTAGGLTYPTTNGTSGEVLTSDGAGNVSWAPPAASGPGLSSRTTASAQTGQIADGVATYLTITAAPTYALHKIETSVAAWVTVYTDTTSRTNDSTRLEYTDPVPGSGVIAEVITTGSAVQPISPGTIGWSETSGGSATSDVYLKVVNKSGGLNAVVVTLYYVPLEV